MKCHCCNAEYKQLYENTFVCPACDHVHRVYSGNEIEYHRNQYRNIERRDIREIDSKGTITPLFHEKRDHICEKRISYIKDYFDNVFEVTWDMQPDRIGDIKHSKADTSTLESLGWTAQISLKTGLRRCVADVS